MSFVTSLRKEWIEQVRSGRLIILAAVLGFFGLTSPVLAKYTPELLKLIPSGESISGLIPTPTLMDAVGQFVKNTNQFGVLLALLLAMGMIAQEKDRGTAAMMLSKPLPRPVFLLAKFAALSLSFLVVILVVGIGAYYYTVILFSAPNLGAWLLMCLLLWGQIVVYIALTLFFSTLVRSQAAAAGMGFGMIIIFSLLAISPAIARYLPDRLLTWSASLLAPQVAPAWPALWVSLGIVAASLIAAILVFNRQEI